MHRTMAEIVDNDSQLYNQISQIILNGGIKVDPLLRIQSTYNFLSKNEIESEVFSIICDLLSNQNLPQWLCQRIARHHMVHDYAYSYREILDNDGSTNRSILNMAVRDKIPMILENWLKKSNHGALISKPYQTRLSYSSCSIKNKRRTLEDKLVIFDDLNIFFDDENADVQPHCLFAILDGHMGIEAAQYVCIHLPFAIIKHSLYRTSLSNAFTDAYRSIDQCLCDKASNESFKSGTTCLVCIVRGRRLHVSWCGDTQMCLMDTHGNVKLVNQAHKPNSPNERSRIEQLGGRVDHVSNDWRVNNSLSVSRSFGDISHKKFVIAEPDALDFDLDENTDYYLILGCDGLWEYLKPEDACNLLNNENTNSNLSEVLVRRAKENGSADNITCIVVLLKNKDLLV